MIAQAYAYPSVGAEVYIFMNFAIDLFSGIGIFLLCALLLILLVYYNRLIKFFKAKNIK